MFGLTFRNPWIAAVDAAGRRLPGFLALLLALGALALGLLAGPKLYALSPLPGTDVVRLAVDRLIQYICILGPLYLVALGVGGLYERRRAPSGGWPMGLATGVGLATGAGGFGAAIGLAALLGTVAPGHGANPAGWGMGVCLAALLTAFQAGGEELFFRGWLQPVLAARWGPAVGLAATSLLFGLAHIVGRPLSPLALINDTLAGALFGLLALRSGRLWPAFAAHFGWNFAEQSIAGATPNPGRDALGSVFDVDLVGSRLLSGGTDEMNGAVEATIVLLALVVVLMAWGPSRRAP